MNNDVIKRNGNRQIERVSEYPRPPRIEPSTVHVTVVFDGILIADTRNALRVLEKGHPPVYYIPSTDVRLEYMVPSEHSSFCEWKGKAGYFSVIGDRKQVRNAAWYYAEPEAGFEALRGYIAFYPHLMDSCRVEDEEVQAQKGGFYGGWITSGLEGPFKGDPEWTGR